jgi:predicted ATPase
VAVTIEQPAGTVTLVFTDVEGSTRLLRALGEEAYRLALGRHRTVVRDAFARLGGYEVDWEGDGFFYAFGSAQDAVAAVSEALTRLESGPIRVRVGMHTGEPSLDPPKYVGLDVHTAARIMSAGHGGQALLSEATRAFVSVEVTDLGEHRLKDIDSPVWIYQLGSERFPPLMTISNTNLPRPASSFVGREREVGEVVSLVREGARLLTLSGPGGSGKTRLAIEAAAELVSDFKNGVFWVELVALRDPALVTETIAHVLGAKNGLAEHIQERDLLLLLDNLEQVVDCAPELAGLLEACPDLHLLCTSRELLRVRGEVDYPVPPLAEAEAVELFCQRSRLEADETVAQLCRRLDDLPLAVELAAARTAVLSPEQILERLSQRLDLLKGGRDAEPRQRTLRATIEWSYDLLTGEEQELFRRLSVFAGGCTLYAAEEVAKADLDTLQSLVDKSLLRFTNERYWMLETIREYAAERLEESGEAEELRTRHAAHFVALAKEAESELRSADQSEWLARLEAEHDNFRAVLVRSRQRGDDELLLDLVVALGDFWRVRGHWHAGRRWLDEVLSADTTESTRRARAFVVAADFAWRQGDYDEARQLLEHGLEQAKRLDDAEGVAHALHARGNVEDAAGEHERAAELWTEALGRWRDLGDSERVAAATMNLGIAAFDDERYDDAIELFSQSLALAEDGGYKHLTATSLQNLGLSHLGLGDSAEAERYLVQGLRAQDSLQRPEGRYLCLIGLAELARASDTRRAAHLLGAAEAISRDTGLVMMGRGGRRLHRRLTEELLADIGRRNFESWTAEGAKMSQDDAVRYVLSGQG